MNKIYNYKLNKQSIINIDLLGNIDIDKFILQLSTLIEEYTNVNEFEFEIDNNKYVGVRDNENIIIKIDNRGIRLKDTNYKFIKYVDLDLNKQLMEKIIEIVEDYNNEEQFNMTVDGNKYIIEIYNNVINIM